ncbi:hypothetical protein CRE_12729 [Caenorhabditis remanei]|uniref:Uncharacterized protein n=1 Tax=Caenorhabditis remanei TaxID=31234 RepID=E3M7H2_CAERE|nr:hypothetical protein CRE_12729 [Caenorhabditis remanei]
MMISTLFLQINDDDIQQQVLNDLKRTVVDFSGYSWRIGELAKLTKSQNKEDRNENREARAMRPHEEFVEKKITASHINTNTIGTVDDYNLESDSESEEELDGPAFFDAINETTDQLLSEQIENDGVPQEYIEIDAIAMDSANTEINRILNADSSFGFNVLSPETLKNVTDSQWASLGSEEDPPRIIDSNMQPQTFDIQLFKRNLSSCLKNYKRTEEASYFSNSFSKLHISKQEETENLRDVECISADEEKYISEVFEPLKRCEWNDPIVQAILKRNVKLFFYEVLRNLSQNGSCVDECSCRMLVSVKAKETPLHLMAAYSSSENLIKYWSHRFNRHGMVPVDIAASRNCKEVIRVFMDYSFTLSGAVLSTQKPENSPSLLSHLALHSNLEYIDREELIALVYTSSRKKLEYVGSMATLNGNTKFIEQLEYIRNDESVIESFEKCDIIKNISHCTRSREPVTMFNQREYERLLRYEYTASGGLKPEKDVLADVTNVVPGQMLANGKKITYNGDKFTIAQKLAENGHYEAFNGLRDHQKRVTDCYGFTPLNSLLQFNDEEVRTQLPFFRSAQREDLFFFISQVIVRNRRGLLKDALDMTLSNPDNFSAVPKLSHLYKEYGLPDYVDLPMETTLSRTGDMRIIDQISELYKRTDNFTKKMKEEDALRCIKSIQDRASRCSEQTRLAVILLMLHFVDVYSSRFRAIMRMYLNRGMEDNVARYVLRTYSKHKNTNIFPTNWMDALDKASTAVAEWNGSVEQTIIENINETVYNRVTETDKTARIIPIIGTKEKLAERRKEVQQEMMPRKKRHIITALANIIELLDNLKL